MSLSLQSLESDIFEILSSFVDPPRVISISSVAKRWARVYNDYASQGKTPAGGVPTSNQATISGAMAGRDFLSELSVGVTAYWMSTIWAPASGFAFVTLSAVGLEPILGPALLKNNRPSVDARAASRRIASSLHSYTTKMVTITATNISTGVTAIVRVM